MPTTGSDPARAPAHARSTGTDRAFPWKQNPQRLGRPMIRSVRTGHDSIVDEPRCRDVLPASWVPAWPESASSTARLGGLPDRSQVPVMGALTLTSVSPVPCRCVVSGSLSRL